MKNAVRKIDSIDYSNYGTTPYSVDKALVENYSDKLFKKDEKGFPRLQVSEWQKLSYQHLENLKKNSNDDMVEGQQIEPYAMQILEHGVWNPFSLMVARQYLERKGEKPPVRQYIDGQWKYINTNHIEKFIKSAEIDKFDEFYYGSFAASFYTLTFLPDGEKRFERAGNETPINHVVIRGLEANYYVNPKDLDWLFIDHLNSLEKGKENE